MFNSKCRRSRLRSRKYSQRADKFRPAIQRLEDRVVLAGAYFISVTYYLQLLAAFLLNAVGIQSPLAAHSITTSLLLIIGGIGIWRGLGMLEGIETYAVALNLGMIGALLVGLSFYNVNLLLGGSWSLPNISSDIDFLDLRVLLGLLIVVQGFETSRSSWRRASCRTVDPDHACCAVALGRHLSRFHRPGDGALPGWTRRRRHRDRQYDEAGGHRSPLPALDRSDRKSVQRGGRRQ